MFTMINKMGTLWMQSQVIAELLSGEEVDGLKSIFNAMDVQKKGSISYEELKAGLHKLGSQLAENEVQQLMEAVSSFGSFCMYAS